MILSDIQIPDEKIRYLRKKLLSWGRDNFADFPWRREENRFHALTAEILLQRTRAEQVTGVYEAFRVMFPDPVSLAEAEILQVEDLILPLGLRWRARYLVECARKLVEMNGCVPDDCQTLMEMPGVGPYVAAAYMSLHTGKRAPIIDSNVVRLYGRFFGFDTGPETRRKKALMVLAERITPKTKFKEFNYALIDVTRAICRPRPDHDICPLYRRCAVVEERSVPQ